MPYSVHLTRAQIYERYHVRLNTEIKVKHGVNVKEVFVNQLVMAKYIKRNLLNCSLKINGRMTKNAIAMINGGDGDAIVKKQELLLARQRYLHKVTCKAEGIITALNKLGYR